MRDKNTTLCAKLYLAIFIIGLGIILTAYFFTSSKVSLTNSTEPFAEKTNQPRIADTYIHNASVISYADSGKVNYELHSDTLESFNAKDTIQLKNPVIYYYQDKHLQVTAKQGTLLNKQHLKLRESVVLKQLNKQSVLNTEKLDVDLEKKHISNATHVSFTTKAATINAVGLHVDLQTENMILKNNVRGVYEP